jgi:hypothetical protein
MIELSISHHGIQKGEEEERDKLLVLAAFLLFLLHPSFQPIE